MKNLRQLVEIVTRKRLRKIEILNDITRGRSENNYYKLYRGIKEGNFESDEDAARSILDTDPSDKKYLMLKSRFKRRLFNSLFFLDETKYKSKFFKYYYECYRNLFVAKILRAHGARDFAIDLFSRTLTIAKKYQFTYIVIECYNELRYNSSLEGSEKKLYEYDDDLRYYEKLQKTENQAQAMWEKLTFKFAKSSAQDKETMRTAGFYADYLDSLRNDFNSFHINYIYYRIKTRYFQLSQKYHEAINQCDEGIKDLTRFPHLFDKLKLADFYAVKIISYLHLRDFEKGRDIAEECLNIFPVGSNNWLFFQEIYFLLAMHTRNYLEAQKIFNNVVNHRRFQEIPANRREKWKIFEAYLIYALKTYFEDGKEDDSALGNFRINKFMNEVPIYTKDKKGFNISIIIAQVLFYLHKGNYTNIIDRMGALKQYSNRYLRKDENYRSNLFIKMLQIMEKEDFDFERTKKLSDKYYQKLVSTQMEFSNNSQTLEIIPFEMLWKSALDQIKEVPVN